MSDFGASRTMAFDDPLSNQLQILHLEDDQADAELIRLTLAADDRPVEVVHVSNRTDFVSALAARRFDLVLSDYWVPGFDGPEALALVRATYPDVPFIIVSGALDEDTAVRLVRGGATDYVLKARLRRLAPAVHQAMREARERRARQQAEHQLESRARQQVVIAELGLQALSGLPVNVLMDEVARRVASTLAVDFTKVLELLPDGQNLRVVAGTGWPEGFVGTAGITGEAGGQAGYTLRSPVPIRVADMRAETRFKPAPLLQAHGVRSGLTVVISGRPRPFGVLGAHSQHPRSFTDDDANFLQAAANVLAEAIARQRAEDELTMQMERLALLAEASQTFAEAGPDYRAVLNAVTRRAADLIGDACILRLLSEDEQWLPVAADWHRNPDTLAFLRGLAAQPLRATEGGIAGEVLHAGRSRLVPHVTPQTVTRLVNDAWWPYWERHGAHSLVAVPLWSRGRVIGVMLATRDETPAPYTRDDQHLLRGLADRAALAIENARLYEGTQQAWGAAELAADRAARLQGVTARLSAALTPDQVGAIIVTEGAAALGTGAATLQILAHDGEGLEIVNSSSLAGEPVRRRRRLPLNTAHPSRDVIRTGQAVWLGSQAEVVARYPVMAEARILKGYEALAVLPLTVESRPMGTLAINFAQPRVFSAEEQAFMLTLAGFCAQALERARLFSEVQEHSHVLEQRVAERTEQLRTLTARLESLREDERARIAREVHDELGGALTAIKMDLSRLARRSGAAGSELPEALAGTIALIDDTVQTVRRIATDLRPALLDDFGLVAALEWQTQEFARRTGIACELDFQVAEVALDPPTATALFRVIQETLINVARHAGATQVVVGLARQPAGLVLSLRDNGRGFNVAELARSPTLGLAGMRERVFSIAGELDIQSTPGQGTTVTVTLPPGREAAPNTTERDCTA